MYIKAKYPKTERWYMHIKSQGYGSGTGGNVSIIDRPLEGSFNKDFNSDFRVDLSPREIVNIS